MGSFESMIGKAKEDAFGSIVLISSAIGVLLSFFYFAFVDGELDFGFNQLVGADRLTYVLESMFSGDFEDFTIGAVCVFPFIILTLLELCFTIVPFVLLCASLAIGEGSKKRKCIAIALIANVLWYPVSYLLRNGMMPDMTLGSFIFVLLTPAAFLVCLFMLRDKPLSASLACAVLCVVGFLFLVTANRPFGYEFEYFDCKDFYISKYLQYAATCVAASFAIAAAGKPSQHPLFKELGLTARKKEPTSKSTLSIIDSASQLKDLKLLLDEGVLTQEEYDLKKKELMGFQEEANHA